MNRDDILSMALEAGLIHFWDSEGDFSGITDVKLNGADAHRNDDRIVEMLAPFVALVENHTIQNEYRKCEGPEMTALQDAAQKPVAYIETITGRLCVPDDDHRRKFPMCYRPLVIAPFERKALTTECLRKLHRLDEFGLFCDYDEFEQIARAVEQAHGIKEEKA